MSVRGSGDEGDLQFDVLDRTVQTSARVHEIQETTTTQSPRDPKYPNTVGGISRQHSQSPLPGSYIHGEHKDIP